MLFCKEIVVEKKVEIDYHAKETFHEGEELVQNYC